MNRLRTGILALSAAALLLASAAAAQAVEPRGGSIVDSVPLFGMEPRQVKEFLEPLGV